MKDHPIPQSELIINSDGSIYHIRLRPEHVAPTIITVGDPERVPMVSKYFDALEFTIQKREFVTHTGRIGKKRITVISTGIGTDNIDIVLNELDALFNIDFTTRKPKEKLTSLDIFRIGTSGSLQADLPVDSFVVSSYGLGLDGLWHFYEFEENPDVQALQKELTDFFEEQNFKPPYTLYFAKGSHELLEKMKEGCHTGITATSFGFYGPQGRMLRLNLKNAALFDLLPEFRSSRGRITNFEMETSAIYGLASALGHRALSFNALIANRRTGEFTRDSQKVIDQLIRLVLEKVEKI